MSPSFSSGWDGDTGPGICAGRIGQAIRDLLDDLNCPHELMELSGGGQSRINVKFKGTPETAVNGRAPLFRRRICSGC